MTKNKVNVLFNIKDTSIIVKLPGFHEIYYYNLLEKMDINQNEFGKIRIPGEPDVCFMGFSKLCIDSAVAFSGLNERTVEGPHLDPINGVVRLAVPTLAHLLTAIEMIMHQISENSTKYPPDFKIWTEPTRQGDFFLRFRVTRE